MKNKKIKKLIFCVASLCASCSLAMLLASCSCSCADEKNQQTMPKEPSQFTFSVEEKSMVVGEEQFIPLLTEIEDLDDLTFTSSNETIASVVNKGGHAFVTANRLGSVTITATLGKETSSCELAISLGGMSPVLQFESEEADVYSVTVNDEFALVPYVYFNGARYYDVEYTYTDYDTSVCTVNQDGDLVGIAKGETSVTATYEWRDIPLTYGEKQFTVEVKDKVEFVVNDGKYGDEIVLYTVAEHANASYDNSVAINAEVFVNGIKKENVVVEQIGGEEAVSFADGTLTAIGTGESSLKISTADGAYEKEISVIVRKPLAKYDGVVDFSADFGTLNVREVFGRNTKLVEAYQDGRALEIVDGRILGVKATHKDRVSQETIEIYNATAGYSVPLNVYLAKIATADEFVSFFSMRMTEDFLALDAANKPYMKETYFVTEGYVELACDIDLTGKEIQTYKSLKGQNWYNNSCAFGGVFNGNGYTVSNLKFAKGSSFGLFGYMHNGTVKNVAFKDVTFDSTTNNQALIGYGTATQQKGLVQDVYISVKSIGETAKNNGALFSGSALANLTLKNIVVEYPEIVSKDDTANGGSLFGVVAASHPYSVQNVYVISKTKRLGMQYAKTGVADYYVWVATDDAEMGEEETVTINGKDFLRTTYTILDETMQNWGTSQVSATGNILLRRFVFDGIAAQIHYYNASNPNMKYGINGEIRRFDDYAAMSAAGLKWKDFDGSEFWYVDADGVLRWKNGSNEGVWKDDAYTPEGGDDSWDGNWKPEDGETFE